jgi:hypothetical protein
VSSKKAREAREGNALLGKISVDRIMVLAQKNKGEQHPIWRIAMTTI